MAWPVRISRSPGFDHSAAHKTFYWDLRHAPMARAHLELLTAERRQLVDPLFRAWDRIDWSALPHSVVHNDANDYNVLVRGGRVVSILDFGDMVYSATVCNLAVAIAYAMLGKVGRIGTRRPGVNWTARRASALS